MELVLPTRALRQREWDERWHSHARDREQRKDRLMREGLE